MESLLDIIDVTEIDELEGWQWVVRTRRRRYAELDRARRLERSREAARAEPCNPENYRCETCAERLRLAYWHPAVDFYEGDPGTFTWDAEWAAGPVAELRAWRVMVICDDCRAYWTVGWVPGPPPLGAEVIDVSNLSGLARRALPGYHALHESWDGYVAPWDDRDAYWLTGRWGPRYPVEDGGTPRHEPPGPDSLLRLAAAER